MNMTSFTYIFISRRQECNLDDSRGLYFDCCVNITICEPLGDVSVAYCAAVMLRVPMLS